MTTMRTEEITLARESLERDLARFIDSDDQSARNRIKGRMIDTVMEVDAVGAAEAFLIVNAMIARGSVTI